MTTLSRTSPLLFAIFFLIGICVVGNYKIITSYTGYLNAVKQDQRIASDSIDLYFEKNSHITKEKIKQYMKLAMERDLDVAYIKPWLYFNIIVYNLLLLTIAWGFFQLAIQSKTIKVRSTE